MARNERAGVFGVVTGESSFDFEVQNVFGIMHLGA
jgi:hypothetical protein